MRENSVMDALARLQITLPPPPPPGGDYLSVNIRGRTAFVAIQLPKCPDAALYTGRIGGEIDVITATAAARQCALNILAQVATHVGWHRRPQLNHYDGYYRAVAGFAQAPAVFDGASRLFHAVLGEDGRHTRAIFGVELLPRDFAVGITASFTLADE